MIVKSQNINFIYEYQFVPNSLKRDSVVTEHTRLEIFKDHSEFLSDLIIKSDSLKKASSLEKVNPANYINKVFINSNQTYSIEYIGIEPFRVIQDQKLSWVLTSETSFIQGYNCQKATLNFGKRQWEAWFTKEIPIQNGPYIFGNLPGLIIKMNDSENHHNFLLIESYKSANEETRILDKPYLKSTEISRIQFNKKWNLFRKNPLGGTEQFMIINPGLLSGVSYDEHGNKIDNNQLYKEERKYAQKKIEENNNPIDLELYY